MVNFCSTYVSPDTGQIIVDRMKIARHYVFSSRFLVDILASFPFEIFLPKVDPDASDDSANASRYQALTGLFKLVRLLRLGRIVTFMKMR